MSPRDCPASASPALALQVYAIPVLFYMGARRWTYIIALAQQALSIWATSRQAQERDG